MNTLNPTTDSFAEIVHDIVAERWPVESDDPTAIDEVTARVVDAYVPRVGTERQRASRAEREMRALVDRDACLHTLLTQARRSAGILLDGQDAALAQVDGLRAVLARVNALLDSTEADPAADTAMVSVAELRPLLRPPLVGAGPRLPVVIAVQPDRAWTMGDFTRGAAAAPEDPRAHYPFIGWACVLHGGVHGVIEPAFLVDGVPVTQSTLQMRGYTLERLA